MNNEEKIKLYNCIKRQFPDQGLYKASRVEDWLTTNGFSAQKLGYAEFTGLCADFPEMFEFQDDGNKEFILVKKWQVGENNLIDSLFDGHPADKFFGTKNIILNDDIIEMTQQSLYALTKILGNNQTVQQMKQTVFDSFEAAKNEDKLDFIQDRYVFPIDYCYDGMLVNGIVTKNLNSFGKSLYFSFEKTRIFRAQDNEREKRIPELPEEEILRIKKLLIENFPVGETLHMASVSKFLTDRGVDRLKFGFYKMKDFLSKMPFLELRDVMLGGVPQVLVTIKEEARPFSGGAFKTRDSAAQRNFYPRDTRGASSRNENMNIPQGKLTEFCNLPAKPMAILEKYLDETTGKSDYFTLVDELCEDFSKARAAGDIKVFDGKLVFPIRCQKADGSPVELTLKPSTYEGKEWFLYFVDTLVRENKGVLQVSPGKQLENFAFLGSWSAFLGELAAKAIDEEWDFKNSDHRNYQILIQYVKYTFSRLMRENKICISENKQFSAFNTGLVDNHYDDIYACFIPNDAGDTQWKFGGFCTAASGGLGKQLVDYFNPLPQPPTYFTQSSDLFFDHTKQLHTDFEHIIVDNIQRLPAQFLYDQFFDNQTARELVEKIRSAYDKFARAELYEQLKSLITENSRLFLRIQNRLKDSIELARKRVRWNYKTAIPSYFPKRDSMSLMLPLALIDEMKPDVALVVELTRSGSYQGQTILTLPQAYIDARLVCRLTGDDWLVTSQIADTDRFYEQDDL